jgi:predicted ester cyclase
MKNRLVAVVVAILAVMAFGACTQPASQAVNPNLALSERFVNEVWNNGNVAVIDELVDASFVRHNPASYQTPVIEGAEAFKGYVAQVRTDFPDFHVAVDSRFADGDMLAASWTVTGTHQQLGKAVSVRGLTVTRFANGKLAEEWVSWDTHGLMQQLGLVPMAETAAN